MVVIKSAYRSKALYFSHKISDGNMAIKPDTHTYWELILLKNGQGTYSVNGKEYAIGKNCLIITRPTDLHAIVLQTDEPYERYNFAFEPNPIFEDMLSKLPADVDVIDCSGNELMRILFRKISYYIEQLDKETAETLMLHAIYEILCNVAIMSRQSDVSKPFILNRLVSQAVEYINRNITRTINANDLTEYLSVSRRHLEKLFLSHLNITPKQYIIARKLILARQDLRAGSSAAEACEKYGFSDYSGFYRQYTKHFGHKPSDAAKSESFMEAEF